MKFRSVLLAAVATLAWHAGASAQAVRGPYVALGAGANLMSDGSSTYSYGSTSPVLAVLAPAPGRRIDPGYTLVASLGWGFGNGLRAEIEGNYRSNQFSDYNASIEKAGMMANVFYDFYSLSPAVIPYVGAGIGFASVSQPALSLVSGTTTVSVGNQSDVAFAYQAIAGLAVPIAAFPGLAITGEYRFYGLSGNTNYSGIEVISTPNSVTTRFQSRETDYSHSLMLGLRYAW